MKPFLLFLLLVGSALPALAKPRVNVMASAPFCPPIHVAEPSYPLNAQQRHVEGDVLVMVTLREDGHVDEVRDVEGDPALTGAVRTAARGWKFGPEAATGNKQFVIGVPVHFRLDLDLKEILAKADELSIAKKGKKKNVTAAANRDRLAALFNRPQFLSRGYMAPGMHDPEWALSWQVHGRVVTARVTRSETEVRDEDRVWVGKDPKTVAEINEALVAVAGP